ncbi:hypothetical protein [Methylorubrum salsuginis]|nr:hypothetical protein [Methylorubrum salsuginis]
MYVLVDSSAGLQILWDVLQYAEINQEITIIDEVDLSFLYGQVYASMVEVIGGDEPGPRCYHLKLRRLAKSVGNDLLKGWTFALPTGGGDSTALNMSVGRILEMRGDDFEVLLCGEPGPDFSYRERVRILPDPKPGEINLPAKKNALADAARYQRLAILHDRVLLPPDFLTRMAAFGCDGGFVGLPILYFLDQEGLRGRRYSDFNTVQRFAAFELTSAADAEQPNRIITRELAPEVGRFSIYGYVPLHGADRFGFLTGSLYTCSTQIWRQIRQDESLPWEYFEDVEFGHRCRALGVPHRLLNTTLALSITGRSTVIDSTGTWYAEGGWRRTAYHRIPFIGLRPARTRPLLARNFEAHRQSVQQFVRTWCKRVALFQVEEMAVRLCGEARQTAIADLLATIDSLRIDNASALERLLHDFERQILGETLEVSGRHELVKRVLQFGGDLGGELMDNWAVKAQCRLTDDGLMPLLGDRQDRVPRSQDWRIRAGLALFVMVAYWRARRELCLPSGALATWHALLRCWPARQAVRH